MFPGPGLSAIAPQASNGFARDTLDFSEVAMAYAAEPVLQVELQEQLTFDFMLCL